MPSMGRAEPGGLMVQVAFVHLVFDTESPDQVHCSLPALLLKGNAFWNNFTPCPGNKGETKCFAWEQPIRRRPGDAQ